MQKVSKISASRSSWSVPRMSRSTTPAPFPIQRSKWSSITARTDFTDPSSQYHPGAPPYTGPVALCRHKAPRNAIVLAPTLESEDLKLGPNPLDFGGRLLLCLTFQE